jgi:hypothetical protein
MHYLGKGQPFIKGKCGFFRAVAGTGTSGKLARILGGYCDSICQHIDCNDLVRVGTGILLVYLCLWPRVGRSEYLNCEGGRGTYFAAVLACPL